MASESSSGSSLLLDEFYEAGDDRFVEEIFKSRSDKKLQGLAERWYRDLRPFARRALLRYVDDGCDRSHHRPLVKKLFKLAEETGDDETMAHFLVAFDRIARRQLVKHPRWDVATRSSYFEYELEDDTTVPKRSLKGHSALKPRVNRDRFSLVTRHYLQRRVFRYFRKIGRTELLRYAKSTRLALSLYEDRFLGTGDQLVDAWSLVHILYWSSPVLERHPMGVRVKNGATLSQIAPAPLYPDAWKGCLEELLELLQKSGSRTVRAFLLTLLRKDYAGAVRGLPISRVRVLLRSPHEELQTFGAELLKTVLGLEKLPLQDWLELLGINNATALPLICELVVKNVSPDRLSLSQCLELSCAQAAPVAELGLSWAKSKPVTGEAGLRELLKLANARVPSVRRAGVEWVTQLLALNEREGKPEHLRELLDARFADVRERGIALMDKDPRFKESTTLWASLAESPYDDARSFLVSHLGEREKTLEPTTLQHVWASTLLAGHRGGRAKRTAATRLAERIVHQPTEVDALLPLLAIALRSIRAPERVAALAALSKAAFRKPALQAAIASKIPELKFLGEEASQ